ncbi:MAG: ribosome silencing factor [Bacteroidota bacterium]|nr:ribosome silencing factor [Bacteroidota bacterium]MDP4225726.1 ribosome silencing factor [Bacteroidota bacterium]MDP4272900.1 ribosome silencing factor [Bacteroidota bacterium]
MSQEGRFSTDELKQWIIEGIRSRKGKDILYLDLSAIENSVTDSFIICHGDSTTQVAAIGDSVMQIVEEKLHEDVWHTEGYENAQWVLLDYGSIVVHIFQKYYRDFYNLEDLWADAKIQVINEE